MGARIRQGVLILGFFCGIASAWAKDYTPHPTQHGLQQFDALMGYLSQCVAHSKRDLPAQVLGPVATLDGGHVSCSMDLDESHAVLSSQTQALIREFGKNDDFEVREASEFGERLYDQALMWTLGTFVDLKYRLGETIDPDQTLAEFCGIKNGKSACPPDRASFLKKMFPYMLPWEKQQATIEGIDGLTAEVNKKVSSFNQQLSTIVVPNWHRPGRGGMGKPDLPKPTSENIALYDQYEGGFFNLSSIGDRLLLTSALEKKMGSLRAMPGDLKPVNGADGRVKEYHFEPHPLLSREEVSRAVQEMKESILENVRNLGRRRDEKNLDVFLNPRPGGVFAEGHEPLERDLEWAVKTNPAALGFLLVAEPRFAPLACKLINSIDSHEVSDARTDREIRVGLLVAGAALTATGVGATVGLALIGASAGTATILLTAAGSAGFWGGAAVGGIGIGYGGYEIAKNENEKKEMRDSYFAGRENGDAPVDLYDLAKHNQVYEDEIESSAVDIVIGAAGASIHTGKVVKLMGESGAHVAEGGFTTRDLIGTVAAVSLGVEEMKSFKQASFAQEASIHTKSGETLNGTVLFFKDSNPVIRVRVPQREKSSNQIVGYKEVIQAFPIAQVSVSGSH